MEHSGQLPEGPEIYQCVLLSKPLRTCPICCTDDESDSHERSNNPDDLSWIDDSIIFCSYRDALWTYSYKNDKRDGGLMKIIPFLSVCYVIAGLASLDFRDLVVS